MQSIAVVPHGFKPEGGRFAQIVHAVNLQVHKDFMPAWNISASVGYFASVEEAPPESSFVIVARDVQGNGGSHFRPCEPDEPPFALVTYDDAEEWSVLLSHEVLEMLVDPGCNYFESGPDPENVLRQAKFLVEVCDPCMRRNYTNPEAPGIRVADFCLPAYYGLKQGSRFTHCNSIAVPYTVAAGGYLTWQNADGVWRQADATGGPVSISTIEPEFIAKAVEACNFRGTLDRRNGNYRGAPVMELAPLQKGGNTRKRKHDAKRSLALKNALSALGV